MKEIKSVIHAHGIDIRLSSSAESDYISLTDIAKYHNPDAPADVIKNWMRIRGTIEFLGLWEKLHNPDFKLVEFDQFKNDSGRNSFVLSPQKWIKDTNAMGIISRSGRYGGTFAHSDIAFEFASWISPEFKLYIIKDYQRLKSDESHAKALDWTVKRELAKTNYKIHTDAIKENLIPSEISKTEEGYTYASEADVINIALFGKTAKQWRNEHKGEKSNMRDAATIEQLIILANLETMNAELIREGIPQSERLYRLNRIAIYQMSSLLQNKPKSVQRLKQLQNTPHL
ncbi:MULTISPECIES: KilA-N domain-containing protein [Acidaminococcus]|uniref:KilA-N domain-containing protein n=1 Tax=Acidaminococcus TaxID=904 RepID=UPI0003FD2D49|nr:MULTISPECIES: KilA-N domain-containing protein [Acidaminococcus]MDY2739990.1 KilA-N domain-containing protein [Acidaminococcus sp.]